MEIKILTSDELDAREKQFCELYHRCFSDKIDETIVAQRYLKNPYKDLCMCVAIDEGRIVSNYSVSPSVIRHEGVPYKCALSLNTMTDPLYVGKGLFVTLAETLYDHLGYMGYSMVYGFPNYISNRTFCTKLGWKDVYEIPTLELEVNHVLPYNCDNILMDSQFEGCSNCCVDKPYLSVEKSRDYLLWRYRDKPYSAYKYIQTKKGSWAIFKRYQNIINIVESHQNDLSDLNDIVGYITAYAIEMKLDKITVWSHLGTAEHLSLEKLGFRNKYPITYFGVKNINMPTSINVYDYANWRIQMGDDNVY